MKQLLADSILFSGMDSSELEIIEKSGHFFEADKGSFIFFEDDLADRFYIVISGRAKVFKTSPDGKEQILLMAGPGDSFGEAALFSGKRFPATAQASEDSRLIYFTRTNFMALLQNHPSLAANLIARLSILLHHLTRLVQRISLEDVNTRLASYIRSLLPDDIDSVVSDIRVELPEKKMILASFIGTIPETLSRSFAKMSRLKILSVEGQVITVHNLEKLDEIASGKKI